MLSETIKFYEKYFCLKYSPHCGENNKIVRILKVYLPLFKHACYSYLYCEFNMQMYVF